MKYKVKRNKSIHEGHLLDRNRFLYNKQEVKSNGNKITARFKLLKNSFSEGSIRFMNKLNHRKHSFSLTSSGTDSNEGQGCYKRLTEDNLFLFGEDLLYFCWTEEEVNF
jgi:hypothetical protein